MEENKQMLELLDRIDASNKKREKYAKMQCVFSAVAAVTCVAVLLVILWVLPEAGALAQQVQIVISDVQQVSSQLAQADWQGLTGNLEEVTQQIADANLGGLAQEVADLVQSSQTSLEQAMSKLNAVDLEALNQATEDLADVIEPLAKLSKLF